jgi:hypothetical protein
VRLLTRRNWGMHAEGYPSAQAAPVPKGYLAPCAAMTRIDRPTAAAPPLELRWRLQAHPTLPEVCVSVQHVQHGRHFMAHGVRRAKAHDMKHAWRCMMVSCSSLLSAPHPVRVIICLFAENAQWSGAPLCPSRQSYNQSLELRLTRTVSCALQVRGTLMREQYSC